MLNPEFRRNLWIELSLHKLIAMPVVLGGLFALAEMTRFGVADAAKYSFMVIVYLWGTRRAAAAVAEEVRGGTWDSQRMSALDAWPMAWAKLFGSTVFTWYGGLICLGVYAFISVDRIHAGHLEKSIILLVVAGLITQAVALAVSLAVLRKHRGERNIPVSLCHLAGLGALFFLSYHPASYWAVFGKPANYDRLTWWHGVEFDAFLFFLVSSLVLLGWAVLAVHRLMRAELQHRTLPWGWVAFTLYQIVFVSGFVGEDARGVTLERLAIGFGVAVAMVYVVFLLDNKNVVTVKAWIEALRARRWFAAALLTPSWFVVLCLAVMLGAVYSPWAATVHSTSPFALLTGFACASWEPAIAMLLFLLRDIGFLLFMNMCTRLRRPDIAGAIYLAVLYGVGGGLLHNADLDIALAFVVPTDTGNAFLTIAPVLVQAAAVYALLAYRLRGTMHPSAAAA